MLNGRARWPLNLAGALLLGAGCSGLSEPPETLPPAALTATCTRDGTRCPPIHVAGSADAATPTFKGQADPALLRDPAVEGRLWMLFSHLEGRLAQGAGGEAVGLPHVSTRLARSDDGGQSWQLAATVWDAPLAPDPEAKGPDSYFGSESTALAAGRAAGVTTWYSARISYFLEPVTAYRPRYASSWTLRVAAVRGESPVALGQAEEAVLGTATTAAAYGPDTRLDALDPALGDCGLWNNPALFAEAGRLYLLAECVVFSAGGREDPARNRIVLLSTTPAGAAPAWRWTYGGVVADHALARALGGEDVVSPYVATGRDGARLLVITPRRDGVGQGCAVLLLDALSPPRLRRDPAGAPVVVARQAEAPAAGWHTGACTYSAASATGLITVAADMRQGLQASLRATGLQP